MYTNEQLIAFCQEAVRIPSYSGQEKRVAELMKRKMEEYGFDEVIIDKYGSVLGTINGKRPGKTILMDGHIDTVDVIDAPQWKHDPFGGEIEDGKIYGRGTADDKGPAVAALYAMRAVNELGIPLKKNVRLILGTDEECGSSDITHYYSVEKEAPMTFSPDASFPVINIEKGRIRAAARRTLTIGKTRGVINLQVRHHADALYVGAADADMNAHAAAQHGEPVDFGERIDEPFSTVLHIGEEARNGKPLLRAAK